MRTITVEELKTRVDAGEQLNVIDVREPSEYAQFNMGAQLLPLGMVMNMQLDDIEELKDKELIIHCLSGKRSMQACMILEQAGFTEVVNVLGGISAWRDRFGDAQIK